MGRQDRHPAEDPHMCWDDAYHILVDSEVDIYVDAVDRGNGWWTRVDLDAGHFTASLTTGTGPFETYSDAIHAGIKIAEEWGAQNNTPITDREIDSVLCSCGLDEAFDLRCQKRYFLQEDEEMT